MSQLKDIVIIYHSPCPDGFAAAYAAWRKFGDTASYLPANHGLTFDADLAGKEVYMLDFSLSRPALDLIAAQAKSFLILDHHVTAQKDLLGLPYAQFDMHRSGAGLAWDYFHPDTPRPALINYVEDRDLFVWKYGTETEYFTSHLDTLPYDFQTWDTIAQLDASPDKLKEFMGVGEQMSRKFQWAAQLLADLAEPIEFHGHIAGRLNAPSLFTTDTGSLIYKENQAMALIWRVENKKLYVSMRSIQNVDVGSIAKLYGGGGHKNAAAFKLDINAPATHVFMQKYLFS
ncbi:MAG: DHHA1 domain-containing protein [Agitococcus sp.]|nr:DHHA1 domain-containing protein [Agitococcus sp.]MDO9179069.1 DHHA1 domain-containing protein [Agitococcus sp.]